MKQFSIEKKNQNNVLGSSGNHNEGDVARLGRSEHATSTHLAALKQLPANSTPLLADLAIQV
jgi:hypothetical protein